MVDKDFCAAVHAIVAVVLPLGYIVAEDAPDDYDTLAHTFRHDGMIVAGGSWDTDNFDSEDTYRAFRAWHDWAHLHAEGGFFTPAGECAAASLQTAQLVALYGSERGLHWGRLIRRLVVDGNFGDGVALGCTGLV